VKLMARGFLTRHSPFPHVIEYFSFFAIYAFLAAIHSQSSFQFQVSPFFHHSIIPTFRLSIHWASAVKTLDGSRDDKAGIPAKSQFSPKVPLRRAWAKTHIRDHPRFIRG
jgi:hypothetical protein